MARPSKLTPDVQNTIVEGIKFGLTYKQAAQLVGIDESTLYRWRRKGEKAGRGGYHQFCMAIKRANEQAKFILLQRIGQAGAGGQVVTTVTKVRDSKGNLIRTVTTEKQIPPVWQACAWILERRFPNEFGRHAKPQPDEAHDPLQEWLDALVEAESQFEPQN